MLQLKYRVNPFLLFYEQKTGEYIDSNASADQLTCINFHTEEIYASKEYVHTNAVNINVEQGCK